MRLPTVELLWWKGCPSTERALGELRAVLAELDLREAQVTMREITTEEDALDSQFAGSPTILIDGEDAVPQPDEPRGLGCRVYRRRDGRYSPTPDPDDLRAALRRATERVEVK
jgi:hypothetical protein